MLFRCSSIVLVALAAICVSTLVNASGPGNASPHVQPSQDTQRAMSNSEIREKYVQYFVKRYKDFQKMAKHKTFVDDEISKVYEYAQYRAENSPISELEKYLREHKALQRTPTPTESEIREKYAMYFIEEKMASVEKKKHRTPTDNDIRDACGRVEFNIKYIPISDLEKYVRDQEARHIDPSAQYMKKPEIRDKYVESYVEKEKDYAERVEHRALTSKEIHRALDKAKNDFGLLSISEVGKFLRDLAARQRSPESKIREKFIKYYVEGEKDFAKKSKDRDFTDDDTNKARSQAERITKQQPISKLEKYVHDEEARQRAQSGQNTQPSITEVEIPKRVEGNYLKELNGGK